MRTHVAILALITTTAATAHAHPGAHGGLSFVEIARHLTEPDHLALLAAAVIVGVLAYRWVRRSTARARVKVSNNRKGTP